MKFLRYPSVNPLKNETAITIGHFDGVHVGHQELFRKINKQKIKNGLFSVVVTMYPLASQYFVGRSKIPIITPFKQKYHLVKKHNIDYLCALNFNKNLASLSADEFFNAIIFKGLNAKYVIVGKDFRFGKNREGTIKELKKLAQRHDIQVEIQDNIEVNNQRVSSTLVRAGLEKGNFKYVGLALDRNYSVSGKIIKGQQLGRTLSFPTINIKIKNIKSPVSGIFASTVKFEDGSTYQGATSVGTRPTVMGVGEILEVYLFDFNKNVYGENVEVFFHHKIRNEVKFEGLEQLATKIRDDVFKIKEYFRDNK